MSTVKIPPVLRASVGRREGGRGLRRQRRRGPARARRAAPGHRVAAVLRGRRAQPLRQRLPQRRGRAGARRARHRRVRERHDRDPAGDGRRRALIRPAATPTARPISQVWDASAREGVRPLLPAGHRFPSFAARAHRGGARRARGLQPPGCGRGRAAGSATPGCGTNRDPDRRATTWARCSQLLRAARPRGGAGRRPGADGRRRSPTCPSAGYAQATVWSFARQPARQRVLRGPRLRRATAPSAPRRSGPHIPEVRYRRDLP